MTVTFDPHGIEDVQTTLVAAQQRAEQDAAMDGRSCSYQREQARERRGVGPAQCATHGGRVHPNRGYTSISGQKMPLLERGVVTFSRTPGLYT